MPLTQNNQSSPALTHSQTWSFSVTRNISCEYLDKPSSQNLIPLPPWTAQVAIAQLPAMHGERATPAILNIEVARNECQDALNYNMKGSVADETALLSAQISPLAHYHYNGC